MWDFWKHGKSAGSSGNLPQCATAGADPTEVGKAALKDSRAPRELRKLASKVVSFKDLHVFMDDPLNLAPGETDSDEAQPGGSSPRHAPGRLVRAYSSTRETAIEKTKLVIIMVGLPGRGKTFLCNKIKGYLNWLGHNTAHFNVGQYRRQYKASNELQDANFFDHKNLEGLTAREAACDAALSDVLKYLDSDTGQVAIFDATNSTVERRSKLICAFHGRYKYLFLESICNDVEVLQQNYVSKMKFSPDYQGVDMEQALEDFKVRIRKYEQVYEPITDRELQYIKLTDMVTGRGYLDVNRISGYIPGKLVFFLMQVVYFQTRCRWLPAGNPIVKSSLCVVLLARKWADGASLTVIVTAM